MRTKDGVVSLVGATSVLALLVGACGSKDSGTTSGAGTSTAAATSKTTATATASATGSAKADSSSAPASSAKASKDDDKDSEKKKPPKEKPADAKKEKLEKGAAENEKKPMPKDAKKGDETVKKDTAKKKDPEAVANACEGVADYTAECAVNKLLYCEGNELYYIDCDERARLNGHVGGTCYASEEQVDCYDYDYDPNAKPDEQIVCDDDYSQCCSTNGYCWNP